MGLDDRLAEDHKRAAINAAKEPYYADEPDWLIYKTREKKPWLNKDRGVFTETDKSSVNKAPSVFDATASFITRRDERSSEY